MSWVTFAIVLTVAAISFVMGYWLAWFRSRLLLGSQLYEAIKRIIDLEKQLEFYRPTPEEASNL